MSATTAMPMAPSGVAGFSLRKAIARDVAECIAIRGRTRENPISVTRLAALGITQASWSAQVEAGTLPGQVVERDGRIVGYCFGSAPTGEVVVLALLPEGEGRGLGKELLRRTMSTLRAAGHTHLFLGCSGDPRHRSHGFYRHLGWVASGATDARGDETLRFTFDREGSIAAA